MMMNILIRLGSIFLKICLGLMLGCIGLIWYLSEDVHFKKYLQDEIEMYFLQEHGVRFQSGLATISIFPPSLVLHDVTIIQEDDLHWSIQAERVYAQLMIKESIVRKKIAYQLYFDTIALREQYQQKPTKISTFISRIIQTPPSGYLDLAYTECKQGTVDMSSFDEQQKVQAQFAGSASLYPNNVQSAWYLQNGSVVYDGTSMIEQGAAQVHVHVGQSVHADITAHVVCPILTRDNTVHLSGSWQDDTGTFMCATQNQGIVCDQIALKQKDDALLFDLTMQTTGAYLQKQQWFDFSEKQIDGNIKATLHGDVYRLPESLYGDVLLDSIMYDDSLIFQQLHVQLEKISGQEYQGSIISDQQKIVDIHLYQQDDVWKLFACNEQDISILGSYWMIPKQKMSLQATAQQGVFSGQYQGFIHNPYLEESTSWQGQITLSNYFELQGKIGDVGYDFAVDLEKFFVRRAVIKNDTHILASLDHVKDMTLRGFIDFALCQMLVPQSLAFMFSQKGKIELTGSKQTSGLSLDFLSQDAHIRIPYIYNLIQNAQGTVQFDWAQYALYIKNMSAQLYKGSVHIQKGTCMFTNSLYPEFVHIPILFDQLLIGWNKQVYGKISGMMGLHVRDKQPKITGDLILNSAEFEGNIFSKDFQEQLFGVSGSGLSALPCQCDISVQSQEPIAVKTSFLDASVKMNVHLTTKDAMPVVQGVISVLDGEFKFPYAALRIVQGKISILPDKHFDPTLFIVAKNRIKRHEIVMRVTGTVHDPHVTFESVPHQSKEQIIAMLLFGSDDNSVVIMPEFLGTQLHDIMFGPAVSESKLESRWNAFLDPLQKIKVYPKFGNQKGRGGMRAIVEVDATEKLKGRIDSNLFQFEDTIFELDYDINDNITARLLRDAPATYGGEVEMRWKWS
jgi:hypothetical protein